MKEKLPCLGLLLEMGKYSRNKGKRGERELAQFLTERGFNARRGQQFCGTPESPDVICEAMAGFHIEVKRTEKLSVYAAIEQATEDAGSKTPLVFHRRNRKPWLVIMNAGDFLELLD